MRRYYASKEELLLELAEQGWGRWRDAVKAEVRGRRGLGPAEVAALLARTVASLPVFCDLLSHVVMSLEDDVGLERARRYKGSATSAYDDLVRTLEDASTLTPVQMQTLVATAVSLAASLWQAAHPAPTLAALYAQEPQWGHAVLDFEPRLTLVLQAVAIGLGSVLAPDQ